MPFGTQGGLGLARKRKHSQSFYRTREQAKPELVQCNGSAQLPKGRRWSKATIKNGAKPSYILDPDLQKEKMSEPHRRIAIAFCYMETLLAPPETEWDGRGGTIAIIKSRLGLPHGSTGTIRRVLKAIVACAELGIEYDGSRNIGSGGQNKLIKIDSIESQIIADAMEQGCGLRQTEALLNEHRIGAGKIHVGLSAVHSACLRLNPIVTPISASKQGNDDPESGWAKARLKWVTQLAIRLGVLVWDTDSMGLTPPQYDLNLLGTLDLAQIVWWDESHKKIRVGAQSIGPTSSQYRFRRDAQGRIDPNGDLAPKQSYMKMKFEGESRFLFGCGIVETTDGTREGHRCKPFKYSGKWVVTISERNQMRIKEIARVRSLPGSGAPWVTGRREAWDGFFMEDPVSALPRVGKRLEQKLAAVGIHIVGDIKMLSDEMINVLGTSIPGTSAKVLFNLRKLASDAFIGAYVDQIVDHKKAANPYLSLYGNEWENQIDKSLTLRGSICVTVLIEHIVNETQALLKGTQFENTPYFYHDALSQMTCEETIAWMKDNGLHQFWILPKLGLNDGTPFAGRPVGNSPEMMPWDCSLNKDIDDSFNMHFAWTKTLPVDDPLKFCRSTPNRQDSGYMRLVDPIHGPNGGVPTSARIIQDVTKCAGSHLLAIIAAKGTVVPGLGSRNGIRQVTGISSRGGHRIKKAYNPDQWVHPDAQAARASISEISGSRFSRD